MESDDVRRMRKEALEMAIRSRPMGSGAEHEDDTVERAAAFFRFLSGEASVEQAEEVEPTESASVPVAR